MAKKKQVNKVEAEKTERTIQYIAIAMIVIVIAIYAWPYIAKLLSETKRGAVPLQARGTATQVRWEGRCWKRDCLCGV